MNRIKYTSNLLWRIIKSRFQKETEEKWIEDRRKVCLSCEYHLNPEDRRTVKQKLIKTISDFYTWITWAENKDLGECGICLCPTWFATRDEQSECSASIDYNDDKWKSIYIPNKSQEKKWKK